jgi:signal peptidase I
MSNEQQGELPPKKTMQVYIKEFKTIAFIIFIILVFRSSFFEPFKIPSGSMIPTLLVGDFILVNKTSYGLKVPFSDWVGDPVYLTGPHQPQRGDIIVFKYPKDTDLNYIKRLIGVPGDRIQIVENSVYINGEMAPMNPLDETKANELKDYLFEQNNQYPKEVISIFETKTGERSHLIQHFAVQRNNMFPPEWLVPEGHFFVMGDNRDNSQDSRYWDFVPFSYVKGKAFLVWLNMNLPIFQTPGADYPFMFNLDRVGKLVY